MNWRHVAAPRAWEAFSELRLRLRESNLPSQFSAQHVHTPSKAVIQLHASQTHTCVFNRKNHAPWNAPLRRHGYTTRLFSALSSTRCNCWGCPSRRRRTLCAIASPRICCKAATTSERCRSYWGSLTAATTMIYTHVMRLRDQSVEMELDASLITWIATSNYPWQIAPTLRSRMRAFYIQMPDAEQAIQLAHVVVAAATKDAGVRLSRAPDKAFVLALAHLNAREIYQLTGSAIAQAVRQGRGVVSIKDLPAEVLGDDAGNEQAKHFH